MGGEAIVARARAVIGTRFRLHGRDRDGLDCVGLVALAHEVPNAPMGYALRSAGEARWSDCLDMIFERRRGPWVPGDILLMRAGPAQLHLGIWTGTSMIHADARLRRVVEMPGRPDWPVIGHWF